MLIQGVALDSVLPPDLSMLLKAGMAGESEAAIISAVDSLTWAELDQASTSLAEGYLGLGLEPGDRLASLMPNRTGLAVHYLACFKAGLVATPLNYRYTHREIDHALSVSEAAAVVAHVERAEDLGRSKQIPQLAIGVIPFGENEEDPPVDVLPFRTELTSMEGLSKAEPTGLELPTFSPGQAAAIFFTSGSTGPAKGVTHSRETIGWMIASAVAALELTSDDIFLPGSSMSHIGSFLWVLSTLYVGGTVLVARTFDSHEVLPLLRDHRPTGMAMIPAALSALIEDHDLEPGDFDCLRFCRSGADAVSTELLREFAATAGFPIDEGYGMTEVGLATLNPPNGEIRQGSIGPPTAGFRIEIRDEDGSETEVGEVGRVWIDTRSRMVGYWEAPEATEEVVLEGWLDSGDLARADEDGYLWFFGRKKQVIVHDGSNVSPQEVEESLLEHPAVALAGVVGVHDRVHGENVRAYITLHAGAEPPSMGDLIRFSRDRIGYKAPEEIIVLDEMPLNPTGKIDRAGLKKMAEDHLHPHDVGE